MTKHIFTAIIGILASQAAFATFTEFDYTYADGKVIPYGKTMKENIGVAMKIDNPDLAGLRITGIKAYVNTVEGLSETSLWLSENLTVENGNNHPDILNVGVVPVYAEYAGSNLGLLETELEQPYTLTGEPLYVGYSMNVESTAEYGQKYPIILTDNVYPDGFWLYMSQSVLKWTEYSERAGGVPLIIVTLEGDLPDRRLDIAAPEAVYAGNNEPFEVNIPVMNKGALPVNNIEFSYSIDGGETVKGSAILEDPVPVSFTNYFPVPVTLNSISGIGSHEVELTVTAIDGEPNTASDASCTFNVDVLPFLTKKRPLVEEMTGLWCQYCPRGYIAMELIAEMYPDSQVSICYHYGDERSVDAMAVTDQYPVAGVTGLPAACIDRVADIDPYYGSAGIYDFYIRTDLEEAMGEPAIAAIEVEAGDIIDGKIDVTSYSRFISDIDNADYEIGYVVTADGLTSEDWVQVNAFSGQGSVYAGTYIEVLTEWPKYVTGLVFNDVAVEASSMMGVEGSLPSSLNAGDYYTHDITIDLSGNDLVNMATSLSVAAFIIDKSNGRIVNANKTLLGSASASVDSPGIMPEVASRTYCDIAGNLHQQPVKGVNMIIERMTDGTVKTRKIIIR